MRVYCVRGKIFNKHNIILKQIKVYSKEIHQFQMPNDVVISMLLKNKRRRWFVKIKKSHASKLENKKRKFTKTCRYLIYIYKKKTQTILVISKLILSNVIRKKTKFRRNRSILCTHACWKKFKQRTIEKIKIKKKKRKSVYRERKNNFRTIWNGSHSPFGRSGAGLRRPWSGTSPPLWTVL